MKDGRSNNNAPMVHMGQQTQRERYPETPFFVETAGALAERMDRRTSEGNAVVTHHLEESEEADQLEVVDARSPTLWDNPGGGPPGRELLKENWENEDQSKLRKRRRTGSRQRTIKEDGK